MPRYKVLGTSGQSLNVEFPNSGAPGIISTLDVGAVWDKNEGDDYIWSKMYQLSRERGKVIGFSLGISPLDDNGLSFYVSKLAQTLLERIDASRVSRIRRTTQIPYPWDFFRLLCLSGMD